MCTQLKTPPSLDMCTILFFQAFSMHMLTIHRDRYVICEKLEVFKDLLFVVGGSEKLHP